MRPAGQLDLPMSDYDRALLAEAKVRAARRQVADRIGHKVLAERWGCSVTKVADKIEERDRNYLKPTETTDLELGDVDGIILAAKCDVAGYEKPERKRSATADEMLARVPGVLRRFVSSDVAEVMEREIFQ